MAAHRPSAFAFTVIACLLAAATARGELCFTATIDGTEAGTGSTGTGFGRFLLSDDETTLTYKITFFGLGSAETASHIHSDAEGGGALKSTGTGATKIGAWTSADATPLTPARVADLKAGLLYHNIHSVNFPAGEIRGQILPAPCEQQCFEASIDGGSTGSPGTGFARLALNHTETELTYHVEFSGLLTPETGAHIHNSAEAGAVVRNLGTGTPKVGVWKWTDAAPLTGTRVKDLKTGMLYVNIHSTGIPTGEISGDIGSAVCPPTGVGSTPRGETLLQQNYPNPFNPATTIAFTLKTPGHVRLDVFGVKGNFVANLVDGPRDAGTGEAKWNGQDADGRPVASGVYFYRLLTSGGNETRKMVLLK